MSLPIEEIPPFHKSALLIIDMSNEQATTEGIIKQIENIKQISQFFEADRIIDSHLSISYDDESSLKKIYPFVGKANTLASELVPQLKSIESKFFKKVEYSSFFRSNLAEYLKSKGVVHIYLTGVNTDYCVLLTAVDAMYNQFTTTLVSDACASLHGTAGDDLGRTLYNKYVRNLGNVCTTQQIAQFGQTQR